jgi:hypothetical protein
MKNSKISTLLRGRAGLAMLFVILLFASVMFIEACKPSKPTTEDAGSTRGIVPQELDPTGIADFHFPEDSNRLKEWAVDPESAHLMYRHGWGLWQAAIAPSGQDYMGEELMVFETWLASGDLMPAMLTPNGGPSLSPPDPRPIGKLRQLQHTSTRTPQPHGSSTILGFVKFNPAAADHVLAHKLFDKRTLNSMQRAGQANVPAFPSTSVAVKTAYLTLDSSNLDSGRYFQLSVWTGEPDTMMAYPMEAWPNCVWIDILNGSHGVEAGNCIQGRTAKATFNLNDFIHFKLTTASAERLTAAHRAAGEAQVFVENQYVVLTALHITTREFAQWTWQSYYWDPQPQAPQLPSRDAIAAERPAALQGAGAHYAMVVANTMLTTSQPLAGGNEAGKPVICYNPYLEALFGEIDLPASKAWTYEGETHSNLVGMRTNCMSCHAYASAPFGVQSAGEAMAVALYTGDRYVGMDDPQLEGKLRCDFLWSVPLNALEIVPAGK